MLYELRDTQAKLNRALKILDQISVKHLNEFSLNTSIETLRRGKRNISITVDSLSRKSKQPDKIPNCRWVAAKSINGAVCHRVHKPSCINARRSYDKNTWLTFNTIAEINNAFGDDWFECLVCETGETGAFGKGSYYK